MRIGFDAQDILSFESCPSSMACDMEEVSSESSKKMKDMEETTSKASWTIVTTGKEKEVWEGEAEKPEATVLWNEAEGVSVNAEGESHHEQTRAKITIREREDQFQMERKADREALGEEGKEIRSPKKKVIRVESQETQVYWRESSNVSRDEAEEISFAPSWISIPQEPLFGCDNRCLLRKW